MKVRTLTLNTMNKEDIVNIKSFSHDKIISNCFHLSLSNRHIPKKEHESKKNKPSSTIFKNNALLKSLSINSCNDYKPLKQNKYNLTLTLIPKINTYKSFSTSKNKSKKGLKLINYINDEKFFRTAKNHKKFLFPKKNYIIKKSRINHDINFFNIRNVITDYTKKYERHSYKIKKVVGGDIFINKIKNDLLKMKFGNQIKLFDNL